MGLIRDDTFNLVAYQGKPASDRGPRGGEVHVTLLSVEEANLETMRHWAEAIQRGDLPEELWAADLEIVNAEGWALEATHHASNGREA